MDGKQSYGAPAQLREAQARCDDIQAEFRAEQSAGVPPQAQKKSIRRDPPPLDPGLLITDDALSLRLAEELEYAQRLIDMLGDDLSNDSSVVMRHSVALQSIDLVCQMLGHLAAVTRAAHPKAAVERIGMAELKARLKRYAL